jgi:hypothetical protein
MISSTPAAGSQTMGAPVVSGAAVSSGPASTAMPDEARLVRLVPVVLTALVLIVAVLTVTPWPVGAYQDDAIYTVLAKALAEGDGYRMINLPGSPHATHYPPGYPFFLSLLWRLSPNFPDNIVLFKFANAAWLAVAALGAWMFARRRLQLASAPAAAVAAAGTLTIIVLLVTGVVLSEPMFMALLFPALLLSERAADEGSVRIAIAAGVACAVLALVRTIGAVIIPAALLVLLHRRQIRAALAMGISAAACLLPWQLWVSAWQHEVPPVLTGKYGAYGQWVAQGYQDGGVEFARDIVIRNLAATLEFLGFIFMPVTSNWLRAVAFAIVCMLAAVGLAVLAKRARVTALFLVAYIAVVLLWPFDPTRFLIAIWPVLTLGGVAAVMAAWQWRPGASALRMLRVAALGLSAVIIGGFVALNSIGYSRQWWASIQRDTGRRAKPVVEWVAAQTNPSDILTVDDDLLVFLYTGRQGTPTSSFTPAERLRATTDAENIAAVRAMIEQYSPRYYITTSEPGRRAADSLTYGASPLLRRYRLIPNAFIYERITP